MFLYKKLENFVILKLLIKLPEQFNPEISDISFGFQMLTSSLRAKKEQFEMQVPMIINIGRVKRQQPPPPS